MGGRGGPSRPGGKEALEREAERLHDRFTFVDAPFYLAQMDCDELLVTRPG